jgi:hypothetical protein
LIRNRMTLWKDYNQRLLRNGKKLQPLGACCTAEGTHPLAGH